jgi:hypothetical protein
VEPSKKLESRQINEEGELIGAVFCEYCGELNRADAAECEHCHEHIADQGPDLRSRLQRISRRASSLEGVPDVADGGAERVTGQPHAEQSKQPSILLKALRAGSFTRLAELAAVLANAFFLLSVVAVLTQPSWEGLLVVIFFASGGLFSTLIGVWPNVLLPNVEDESQEASDSQGDLPAAPVRWNISQLMLHLGSILLGEAPSMPMIAIIIGIMVVIFVFGWVTNLLAR